MEASQRRSQPSSWEVEVRSFLGQAGQQGGRLIGDGELLLTRHILDACRDVGRLNAMEIEPLAAGQNGGRHLLDLGRRQNKDDVGRRLLQGF